MLLYAKKSNGIVFTTSALDGFAQTRYAASSMNSTSFVTVSRQAAQGWKMFLWSQLLK
jgi:hypothetical protein